MADIISAENTLYMTPDSVSAFLEHEADNGASYDCLRQRKTHVTGLFAWLPEEKLVTKENLLAWRRELEKIYSQATVLNYVKSVNRYLDYFGRTDLRFSKGRAKDLTGQVYGYLTAIENTGEKDRKDYIWKCRCRCGNEINLPATRLLTGNTLSCGCLHAIHLQQVNQYIDNTSLRMSMEEKVFSERSSSGYTGVVAKRGKWQAHIYYKGKQYSLGCYSKLEDAVKARARGKELVREDTKKLLAKYEALHQNDPPRPKKKGGIP